MTRAVGTLVVAFVTISASSAGPAHAQRDIEKRPAGTAVIRGRVVAADTGFPIRDAMVGIAPTAGDRSTIVRTSTGSVPPQRAVLVDADGRFELATVPPGQVRVVATPGSASLRYLSAHYPDPASETPQPLRIKADQTIDDLVIRLPRAGAIAGRVVNERGEPLGMTPVLVYEALPGDRRRLLQSMFSGPATRTDDNGSFRVFGLAPGSYYLLAQPLRPSPMSPITITNEYAPTFYPGTQSIAEAMAIKVEHGDEHLGVELVVGRSGRTFHVRGTVVDADGNPAPMVQLRLDRLLVPNTMTVTNTAAPMFASIAMTDAAGGFVLTGVPIGETTISVHRYGGRGAEFAWVPLTVTADLEGVTIRLQPGVTVRGRVTFDEAPPAAHDSLRIRGVSLRAMASVHSTTVQPDADDTFALEHQYGPILLRAEGLPGWHLKSVNHAGRDITETPTEFSSGSAEVELVLTRRTATLTGTATTNAGVPTDAAIVLFSENPTLWQERATTTKLVEANADGRFRVDGIRPGRYLAVALPSDVTSLSNTPAAYFELLAKYATPVAVLDNEKKALELKVQPIR